MKREAGKPEGPYCAYDVVRLGRSTESSHAVARATRARVFLSRVTGERKDGKVKVVRFME